MEVAAGEQRAGWTSSIYPEVEPGASTPRPSAKPCAASEAGVLRGPQAGIVPDVSSARGITGYFRDVSTPLPGDSVCLLPWQQLALTTDGEALVHMRCFDFRVGGFPEEDLSALFNGERMRRFRAALRKSGYCLPGCDRCPCALAPGDPAGGPERPRLRATRRLPPAAGKMFLSPAGEAIMVS